MDNIESIFNKYITFREDPEAWQFTMASIKQWANTDNLTDDRCRVINYNHRMAEDEDDFFLDMGPATMFIMEDDAVAYTRPDKIICLRYPSENMIPMDGDRMRRWYFVFCHECLHQLWNTWNVGDKIKAKYGELNFELLNVASDCVINDYLDKVRPENKLRPVGGIFPDVIKDQFGVEYDRNVDSQFSLYEKINKVIQKDPEKYKKKVEELNDKITPKEVRKQQGGGPPPPPQKHSRDYINGWTQGIKDAMPVAKSIKDHDDIQGILSAFGKLDPKKNMPSSTQNPSEYEQGWHDVISQIIQGLIDGIDIGEGGDNGGGEGDLPRIPWDTPPDNNKGKGKGKGKDGDNKDNNNDDNGGEASDLDDAAQEAADAAKESVKNAVNSASKAKDSQSREKANEAAKRAAEAAQNAQNAADEARDALAKGDIDKAIEKTQEAAAETRRAAQEAQNAKAAAEGNSTDGKANGGGDTGESDYDKQVNGSKSGDDINNGKTPTDGKSGDDTGDTGNTNDTNNGDSKSKNIGDAIKAAKNAAKNANNQSSQQGGGDSSQKGDPNSDGGLITRQMIQKASDYASKVVDKYRDSMVGAIGDFVKKCKASKQLRADVVMQASKGNGQWPQEVFTLCMQYIKDKIDAQKQYQRTYSRVRRGERAFTKADLRGGKRALMPARVEKRTQIGFSIAVYIDVSSSMSHCIKEVFDAAYAVCKSMKNNAGQDKAVDANAITLDSYVFTTTMKKIKFGERCAASGGTYEFERLIHDIHANGQDAYINLIITDAEFSSVNENQIIKEIKDLEGMVCMVSNNQEKGEREVFEKLRAKVAREADSKFTVVWTDTEFTVK